MKFGMQNVNFVIAVLLVLPFAGKAVDGVHLVCDEPVFNFGRVDQSAVVTNIFKVHNDGNLTFVLKQVKTSCSCTKAALSAQMIAPGETADLTAVFTAARRSGPQKKSIKLMPNDSEEPALTLSVEGFIEVPPESSGKGPKFFPQ